MRRGSKANDPVAEPPPRVDLFGGPTVWMEDEMVALSPLQTCLVAVVFSQETGEARRPSPSLLHPSSSRAVTTGRRPYEGVPRSTLARLLWEEDTPETRHRLSQLLYSISRKLDGEELFDTDAEAVRPGPAGRASDLFEFQELLRQGDLGPAIELLERGYLSRITSMPGRRFERWLDRAQDRVRSAFRRSASSR
ncbi:MAG: hypothetical protein ACOC8K_02570, partial [Gemmatimonadota bacterium]